MGIPVLVLVGGGYPCPDPGRRVGMGTPVLVLVGGTPVLGSYWGTPFTPGEVTNKLKTLPPPVLRTQAVFTSITLRS